MGTGSLERLFAPRWAGGWAGARIAFGLAALYAQALRYPDVRDALAAPNVVFASGPTRIADHVLLGPVTAWGVWAAGLLPVLAILVGGRWAKPGIVGWLLLHAGLLAAMGLNVRVPERLILWIAAGLLLGPVGERDLTEKHRSPAPRWFLSLVLSGLYGSTGWLKLLAEPAWWTGEALRYDLVDRFHAGGWLATWLSGHPSLCLGISWFTMLFEASFPILIWWPAATPWLLLGGVAMHLGIGTLMRVGPLGVMAVAAYPAVCDPDRAAAIWMATRRRLRQLTRRV